jgi:hypothetical protein
MFVIDKFGDCLLPCSSESFVCCLEMWRLKYTKL